MKLPLRTAVLSLLFLFLAVSASGQYWHWARKATNEGTAEGMDVAADALGNTYVVGNYTAAITFFGSAATGNFVLPLSGSPDVFLAKYGPNGNVIWAKQIGGTGFKNSTGIALDAAGHIFITGSFSGNASFGRTVLASLPGAGRAIFLAKYDNNGDALWARKASSVNNAGVQGEDDSYGVAVDAAGNSYITGSFLGNAAFDDITIRSNGGTQAFVAKYDPEGRVVWARSSTNRGNDGLNESYAIAVDKAGNSYLSGYFHHEISFDNKLLTSEFESKDIFLVKYNTNGEVQWARKGSSANTAFGSNLAVDDQGNCYLAGSTYGSTTFDNLAISRNDAFGSTDGNVFLAKYDAQGTARWAQLVNATAHPDVAANVAGEVYLVTNSYELAPQMDHFEIKTTGFVLTQFGADGQPAWTKSAAGEGYKNRMHLALDAADNCYITGSFFSLPQHIPHLFDRTLLKSFLFDMFVAKLLPDAAAPVDISFPVSDAALCTGTLADMNFSINESYNLDRNFQVQLSDASGSFANPIALGFGAGSPVRFQVPGTVPAGRYRVRVVVAYPSFEIIGSEEGMRLTVYQPPAAPVVAPVAQCGAGSVTLVASGAAGTGSFRWYTNATGGQPIPGETGARYITPSLQQATTFYVAAVNENGCEGPRAVANVLIDLPPVVVAGPDETLCSSTGSILLSGFSPLGGSWSGPGVSATGLFSPALAGPGTHLLTYTVTTGACTVWASKEVTVAAALVVEAGLPQAVCLTSPAFIMAASPAGGTWSGKGVTPAGMFDPAAAGAGLHTLTYTVQTATCTYTGTKPVTVAGPPAVSAYLLAATCSSTTPVASDGYVQGFLPLDVSFQHSTAPATTHLWEFGDGTTSAAATPAYQYTKAGTYNVYLTVYYGNGCTQRLHVADVVVEKQLLPNIFTPNGDGLNDTFAPHITCSVIDLKVFNRYGTIVYEQKDYQNNWDGGNLAAGVYYYYIRAANKLSWKGWVELIR